VKTGVFWGLTPCLVDRYHLSFTMKVEVSHTLQKTLKGNGHRSENFEANNATAITSYRANMGESRYMHNAWEMYRVDQNWVKWFVKCALKQVLNFFITNLYRPVTGVIDLETTRAADLPVLTGLNLNIPINTRVHWLLVCSVVKILTVKQEEVLDTAGCPILSLFLKKDCCTSLVTFSPI